jgi:galactokinase
VDYTSQDVEKKFRELFGGEPLVVRAPGRINLIGEHTDYNDGFVMPAAIDKDISFAVAPASGEKSAIYSMNYGEFFEIDISDPQPVDHPKWANYLLGVMRQFIDQGFTLKPFQCVFGGNIPAGAGLSSSAAMECGFAFALNTLQDFNVPRQTLIRMAQWSEHHFVGVKCGIMDQFASMMGADGKVIVLDCRSLDYHYAPLALHGHAIVLCNTGVKHALVDSEYNTRRSECEQGVQRMKKHYPEVKSLRDVTLGMLRQHQSDFPEQVYRRCLYIVEEIKRVQEAAEDLRDGDLVKFGKKMFETHDGLSKLYEVSCPELDFLVEQARQERGILGSRMMGGGFGGCTINIIRDEDVQSFVARAGEAYRKAFNLELIAYIVHVKSGVGLVGDSAAIGN